MPESEPVQHEFYGSSRVSHAWYYADTQQLVVQFPDGNKVRYYDVHPRTWQEFIDAGSAGRFVNQVLTVEHRYETA